MEFDLSEKKKQDIYREVLARILQLKEMKVEIEIRIKKLEELLSILLFI